VFSNVALLRPLFFLLLSITVHTSRITTSLTALEYSFFCTFLCVFRFVVMTCNTSCFDTLSVLFDTECTVQCLFIDLFRYFCTLEGICRDTVCYVHDEQYILTTVVHMIMF